MKIRPIKGRIVLRPIEHSEKTKDGIIIPESAREKTREGEVVAVADDATEEVAVGDHVIYKDYSGTEVNLEDETYILLENDDLLVKFVSTDKIPD